jgi:hypothetical protein
MEPVVRLLIAVGVICCAVFAIAAMWSSNDDRQVGNAIIPSTGQRIVVSPELKYDDRFQVLSVPRGVDGVICVVVVDRISGETKNVSCFPSCRQ